MEESQPSCMDETLASSSGKEKRTPAKRVAASPQTTPSSRRTRSQAAPDWTMQEMLVLISEVAAVDEDWLKALSSYQKWKMISDNCIAFDVNRSSNQCKRKWELLLDDYRKIRDWESSAGPDSYWSLDSVKREQYHLPAMFDKEVFGSMDAVIKAQEDQSGSRGSGNSDSENLIATAEVEMLDVDLDPKEQTCIKTGMDTNEAREIAEKLQETAEKVHAILRGELMDNANKSHALVDLSKPNAIETEFTRRQADQLIKAFGDLVSTLDQFTELIKDGGCEEMRPGPLAR